jgi:serine/threonine protein kinase
MGDLLSVDSGGVSDGPNDGPDEGEPTRREIGLPAPPAPAPVAPAALSGRVISHFRVGELLGSGGMGVVYGAEDVQLGRSVALKFLAPELVRDPQAKARFLTEARAASALDHPNLCTILEVGETEEGLFFLAMPLYEGESLESRLARGAVPIEEAIDTATQVAQGLAKAHRHGIVHRDIKPGNLLLTRDGLVKILDFGIAKLMGEVGPTRIGSFLGTPSYMAPEQTRGEPVDARADVWSLGVVLYEMLAGRRPFTGGTGAAVVHAVLYEEPAPLARLRPGIPQELERILARMLARDPSRRYASAAEVLEDLRATFDLPTTGSRMLPGRSTPGRRRAFRTALLALGLVALGGVIGTLLWRRGKDAPSVLQPANFNRLTDLPGKETSPSISPDGTFFVYAKSEGGNFDLFLQRVQGGNPINLTASSPADDIQPAFSPNGQQIAFRSERDGGGIFVMGATGESVRRLTDFGFNPSWSPDGREIAVATEEAVNPAARLSLSQIYQIDVATEARRSLNVQDGVQPAWSPHGWRIAYWGVVPPRARRAIWTIPADGGRPVTVVDDGFYNWSPAWSPDGNFLYFASTRGGSMNLWRVAIDERSGELRGAPQPVTASSEWSALPSLSRDGRFLLYATDHSRSFVERLHLNPETGQAEGPPSLIYQGARAIRSCDVSPDGAWLVLRASFPQDDLLLVRSDGSGDVRQLTHGSDRYRTPQWSPDGSQILFSSNRSGRYEAWTIRPDGSGLTQVTHLPGNQPVLYPFWSPDGRKIGFTWALQGTALLDLAAPGSSPRLLPSPGEGKIFAGLAWSKDGRYLTGMLERQDGAEIPGIFLWSLADNTYRHLSRTGDGPSFFHDRKRILYTDAGVIQLLDVPKGDVRAMFSPQPHSSYTSAGVWPDDRSLCTIRTAEEGDIWIMSLPGSAEAR